jgi:hypothetical protein
MTQELRRPTGAVIPRPEGDPVVETMETTQARMLVSAAAYADPVTWHTEVAKLRRQSPVWRVEPPQGTPFWAVLGQPEVMEVERNSAVFTNAPLPAYIPVYRCGHRWKTPATRCR